MSGRRRQGQYPADDIREKARAALTLAEATGGMSLMSGASEEFTLEAFMGVFHPEMQKDKNLMRELKAGMRKAN